jgi:hypothetical protein
MRAIRLLLMLAALAILTSNVRAVDLTKIERSIAKEPEYQTKDVHYCLIVFGPEAKTRVWLVVDGDVLYLDRNGNGDLTEPGERIEPHTLLRDSPERPDMKLLCDFILNRRIKGGRYAREPTLSCVPEVTGLIVSHWIPADGRQDALAILDRKNPFRVDVGTAQYEEDSSLDFASRPKDAPILHFDGPRQFALPTRSEPLRRGETSLLAVELHTPGLGASMRTWPYGKDKENIHPIADFECPPRRPGGEPVRFRLELPGRG